MDANNVRDKCSIRSALPQLRHMLVLTFAGMLQNGIDFLRPVVFNLFVSKNLKESSLDEEERAFTMDCVALASITINIVCFASATGFNTGIDAFAPIAFGAQDTTELHLVLYRQLILLICMLAFLLCILQNSAMLLVLIGEPVEKANGIAHILQILCWSVPGDLVYDVLARWAKSQQKHRMVTVCVLVGFSLNLSINILASTLAPENPIAWPMNALIIQNSSLPLLILGALYVSGHRVVLTSSASISKGLGNQLRTCLQAMVWSVTEMWAWEVQVFEAGRLGPGAAASYSILSMTYSLFICLGMGVYPALTALIGEALGAQKFCHGIALLKLGSAVGFVSLCAYAFLLMLIRKPFTQAFSSGVPSVANTLFDVIPLILVVQLVDALKNTVGSWLVVRRLQAFLAMQSIACYWIVAVPFGWLLCFRCNLGISGLYIGLGVAIVLLLVTSARRIHVDFLSIVERGRSELNEALLHGAMPE